MARVPIVTSLGPLFLGACYFAEAGKTVEGVLVAAGTKPAGSVLTTWQELGCIELANLLREYEGGQKRWCPNLATGNWEPRQTVGNQVSLGLELTIQEVSEFLHRVAWNAAAIDGTDGEFVPNSQPEGIYRGWLLIQQQNGTEVTVVAHLWGELTMPNAMQVAGKTSSIPQVRFNVLGNALNVGNFGTES